MIIDRVFLNKLKDFGLNSYEIKLWTALLGKGISTAGELSDMANVPRSRSYDVLESLEKKGFVIMKLGKPIRYLAVPPEEVIVRIKKNLKTETQEKLKVIEKDEKEIIGELTSIYEKGISGVNPSEFSGVIQGRDAILDHLRTMFKKSQNSIIIHSTPNGIKRKITSLEPILKKLNKKGVKIKISTQDEKKEDLITKQIGDYKKLKLNSRFCIIDNDKIVFMLNSDEETHPDFDTAIWITSKYFVNSFKSIFEHFWNNN